MRNKLSRTAAEEQGARLPLSVARRNLVNSVMTDSLTGDLRSNQRGKRASINREFVKRHFEAVNRQDAQMDMMRAR